MADDLETRVARLEALLPTGVGVSTSASQSEIRATQVGFPIITTAAYDDTVGYAWAQNVLDLTLPGIDAPAIPRTGDNAFTPDNNESLPVGTEGWLEIDPDGTGWILLVASAGIRLPVQLTSTFSSTTGYQWARLALSTGSASYSLASPPVTGNQLVIVDNDQTLQPPRNLIMWPDPDNAGWWMGQLWPMPLVKNVCLTKTLVSGVLTDVNIEVESWLSEPAAGTTVCITDPDECCEDELPPFCPGSGSPATCPDGLPYYLDVTFAGFSDVTVAGITYHFSDLNGTIQVGGGSSNFPGLNFIRQVATISDVHWAKLQYGDPDCPDFPGGLNFCEPLEVGCPSIGFGLPGCISVTITDFVGTTANLGIGYIGSGNDCNAAGFDGPGVSLSISTCNPFLASGPAVLYSASGLATSSGTITIAASFDAPRRRNPALKAIGTGKPCGQVDSFLAKRAEEIRAKSPVITEAELAERLKRIRETMPCNQAAGAVAAPAKITKVDLGPGRRYNASLIRYQDRLLLAHRNDWPLSTISIAHLDSDFKALSITPLKLNHPECAQGQDDPRLFVFRDRLHLEFTGISFESVGPRHITVMLALLRDDLTVEGVWQPAYERHATYEKNWMPFEFEDRLLGVYSTSPHRIIEFKDGAAVDAYETPGPPLWPGTAFRGGCPPVRLGDEFYSFFHTHQKTKEGVYVYTVGCYTFEAKPPFRFLRCTRGPIWQPDSTQRDLNATATFATQDVIYPCGALIENGTWFVSAGHQDHDTLIGEFNAEELDRLLK